MAFTLINDYEVIYSANTFPPRIVLAHAGEFIGQLFFHPNGAALPPDGFDGNQVGAHEHNDRSTGNELNAAPDNYNNDMAVPAEIHERRTYCPRSGSFPKVTQPRR